MRLFKWIDWNLRKVESHGLSGPDVESAFDRIYWLQSRSDDSYKMFAETKAGRRIWVIWRYDREDDAPRGVLEGLDEEPVFVITAY